MNIIATVLLGPGAEETVGDAIRSAAPYVDDFMLVESGCGRDAQEKVRKIVCAKSQYACVVTTHFDWTNDYGAARQFALDRARAHGADWAMTLDPDERLELGDPAVVRANLEQHSDVTCWEAIHRDERYAKERFIRCDSDARWVGRSCEYLERSGKTGQIGQFWELPHDQEHMRSRFERGLVNMRLEMDRDPDNPRWVRHMAACLAGLGRDEEAIDYQALAREMFFAHGAIEHACWEAFSRCETLMQLERYELAWVEACEWLGRHAGLLPEFGSVLATIEYRRGNGQNAVRWAQLAANCPRDRTRRYFHSQVARSNAQAILAGLTNTKQVKIAQPPEWVSSKMREILSSGKYEAAELSLVAKHVRRGDRVLEFGGGCGLIASACAMQGASVVVSFEADERLIPWAQETAKRNGVGSLVSFVNRAIGGRNGTTNLRVADEFWSNKTVFLEDGPEVPMFSAGAACSEFSPTVLICDVEGAEAQFVGQEVNPECRTVIVEIHPIDEKTDTRVAVHRWLTPQGFQQKERVRDVLVWVRGDE